ncbi:hypothetical protein D3C84_129070 [compost metagenome]
MSEPVHRVRELGDDRRIDGVVEVEEGVDVWLDRARELLEHQVLILHLGRNLGRLEQALAVPHQHRQIRRDRRDRGSQPLVQQVYIAGVEQCLLDLVDLSIMFGMEDVMHGRQADVLVHAAVAGDVVRVEQFVVVLKIAPRQGIEGNGITGLVIGVRGENARGAEHRHRVVRDVVEEPMAGRDRADQADRCIDVALNTRAVAHDDHR